MNHPTLTVAALDAWRDVADPLADAVIAKIYQDGNVAAVNDLLNLMVHHDEPPPASLPPAVAEYFRATAALPAWADPAAITLGEDVFLRHGIVGLASLICASLPECYAMHNGVQVLTLTRQLGAHTERRIYETAQMVISVMAQGGLLAGGAGVRAAQKVRLMHAAMRYLLEVDPDGVDATVRDARTLAGALTRKVWNPAWGHAINQADKAFTLQTFSTVMLRSWASLGVTLAPAERDAYFHCWRVVGHVIGVDEALNPSTPGAGEALFLALAAHQQRATPEGAALTQALADTAAQTLGLPTISVHAVTLLMRHLLGDATATMLGVAETSSVGSLALDGITGVVRAASVVGELVGDEIPLVSHVSAWFGEKLLARLAQLDRGGARQLFHLPRTLRDAWQR